MYPAVLGGLTVECVIDVVISKIGANVCVYKTSFERHAYWNTWRNQFRVFPT